MNTPNATRMRGFALSVLTLILALSLATPATAQMAQEDDELERLAQLERALRNTDVRAKLTSAEWAAYGERLGDALASGHDGLRQGALRMIIQYGDDLRLRRPAIYDVVRIYRNHDDDDLRRMAVVALGETNDAWAIDLLRRSVRYEKTPRVRHTIISVLASHDAASLGPAKISRH